MTFREFMQENGYDLITTFWEDFSIADQVWYSRCQRYLQTCVQRMERRL